MIPQTAQKKAIVADIPTATHPTSCRFTRLAIYLVLFEIVNLCEKQPNQNQFERETKHEEKHRRADVQMLAP